MLKIDFENQILALFDIYFWPFNKSHEKINAIFVISATMASIWNVFFKFRWHDEKLITVIWKLYLWGLLGLWGQLMHKWQAPNINKDDLNPLQFSIVNQFKRLLYPSAWFLHSWGRFLHFWGYFIHSWGHLNPLNKEPNTSLIRAYLKVMDTSAPAPEDVKNLLILTEEITK